MSFREIREQIIAENVPKLVKSLLGINETDPNFKVGVDYLLSNIINTKYTSVNSHELRRQINGLGERFEISNYKPYGDRLKDLCKSFCSHPICKDHPETDIEWRILSFLLNTSRNPIDGVTKNKQLINLGALKEDANAEESDLGGGGVAMRSSFVEQEFSDSELSVWSDDEDENAEEKSNSDCPTQSDSNVDEYDKKIDAMFPGLQRPQKPNPFTLMDTRGSVLRSFLFAKVQHHWWNDPNYIYPSVSDFKTANYCHFWNDRTDKLKISTTSEYCLIREILFMFRAPTNCKFFSIVNDSVEVNDLVSLNSLSLPVIQSFLKEFSHIMTLVRRLDTFCRSVKRLEQKSPPHTYQCFVDGIEQCMGPFLRFVLAKERQVNELDQLVRPVTIVNLHHELREHFTTIEHLYKIYHNVTLDFNQYPNHVCAAYLICGLMDEIRSSITASQNHYATTLFLVSIQTYLRITDNWCTEGRLEDWRDEYLVKSVTRDIDLVDVYELRTYDELDPSRKSVITDCSFFKILQTFAVEAGFTLSILYKMDKIRDVRKLIGSQDNLYNTFLQLLSNKLPKPPKKGNDHLPSPAEKIESEPPLKPLAYPPEQIAKFRNEFAKNPFMFLFEKELRQMEKSGDYETPNRYIYFSLEPEDNLFERLRPATSFILPYCQFFRAILTTLLRARLSVANNYVLEIYKNEHQLVHHLHNLQKIYFIEAGDLMSDFYSNLFTQIESGNSWNNPFILTAQLNGILSYRISNSSFLFKVHVNTKESIRDVIRAIDEISLSYVGDEHLYNIISEPCIEKYNKVFRFLLKMKWGIWTLENLRFPVQFKKIVLYGEPNIVRSTFKRLALLRNWLMYSLQSLLSHFMTTVLHFQSHELNTNIESAKNLTEIINTHSAYINKVAELCFQTKKNENICQGITQLLSLVSILKDEWLNIESSKDELDGSFVLDEICSLEKTYINCHAFLADTLLSEVYTANNAQMAGLSAAFNCSRPY
ncbi:gamma-tubulin complex component 5-like [Bradysia coprophila]|uniref:gamma-tubulin complex component 5-like n=1 Tax=Bradysia coprophila TaxID=38358 RepID=UPI00187D8B2A|nr:gamma-tubulin complex component 5-like [Bradysia coprophila]